MNFLRMLSINESDLLEQHKRRNAKREVTIPIEWLHLGSPQLDLAHCVKIRNEWGFPKPIGGFWLSPYTPNGEYLSDWQRFRVEEMDAMDRTGCVYTFSEQARIAVIDTQNDLIDLVDELGGPRVVRDKHRDVISNAGERFFDMIDESHAYVNFEEAAKKYDVIYLTERGQYLTRIPFINSKYNLMGWDCESCIVLNPHIMQFVKSITI